MNRRNYYRLLHVQPDAPAEVIRAAYRALMALHHPDKGGAHEVAVMLNEAWAVLSDPERRAAYDATRRIAARGRRMAEGPEARQPQPGRSAPPPGASASSGAAAGAGCLFCAAPVHAGDVTCGRCGSPLTPPPRGVASAAPGRTGEERRRLPRVSRADWAILRLDSRAEAVDVRLRNLSLEGVSFYAGLPLLPGARVRVTATAFDAVVEVLRCTRSGNVHVVQGVFVTVRFAGKGGFVQTRA